MQEMLLMEQMGKPSQSFVPVKSQSFAPVEKENPRMEEVTVMSLGGSIIAPDDVDHAFLKAFRSAVIRYLEQSPERRLIIVTGGGAPARKYQQAYRSIVEAPDHQEQDWIGIAATHLNGRLLKAVFADYCSTPLVTDPSADFSFSGGSQIIIAAGWKPGFSTDNDAVVLAEKFHADRVINLSNIKKIYSADPKIDPEAVPLDHISWADFRKMVGDEWSPGKNVPFDPIAAKKGAEMGLEVITAEGRNIGNTAAILERRQFEGTVIGPL